MTEEKMKGPNKQIMCFRYQQIHRITVMFILLQEKDNAPIRKDKLISFVLPSLNTRAITCFSACPINIVLQCNKSKYNVGLMCG